MQKIEAKIRKPVTSDTTSPLDSQDFTVKNTVKRAKRDQFTEFYEEPAFSFMQEVPTEAHQGGSDGKTVRLVAEVKYDNT